jgi:hypothetical protein
MAVFPSCITQKHVNGVFCKSTACVFTFVRALLSLPQSINNLITLSRPCSAANINGVQPSCNG